MVVQQLGVILVCLSKEVSARSYSAIYPDLLFKWSQFPLPTTMKRVHFLHLLQHPMSSLFMCTYFFCYWLLIEFILLWIVCFISFALFFSYFLAFLLTNFTNQSEDIYLYVIPSLSFVFWFCLWYMLTYDIHCQLFMWSKIQLLFLFSFLSRLHRSPTPMVMHSPKILLI